MKLVFTAAEVATALQITPLEFERCRPDLERHGFPVPLPGLEARWSIIDVVNWVNSSIRLQPGQKPLNWPTHTTRLS